METQGKQEASLLETLGLRCPCLPSSGDTQEAVGHISAVFGREAGLKRRVWEGTLHCWPVVPMGELSPVGVGDGAAERGWDQPDGTGQGGSSPCEFAAWHFTPVQISE